MTDPVDRLPELSAPRALPAELRVRLEEAFLAPVSRPLSPEQDEALTEVLRDPVGERLADLGAPRALSPAFRSRLQQDLARRQRWRPVAAAAVAAAAVVVGVVLALPGHRTSPPASTAVASPSSTALLGTGGLAGAGTAGGGTTGGGTTGGATTGSTSGRASRAPAPGAAPAAPPPVIVTAPRPSPTRAPSAAPTVSSISPSSGAPGTWVTLTGRALAGTTRVTFGGVAATGLRVVSATEVRARSPQHLPGPVDVVLTTASGSSAPQRYLFL